MSSLLTNSVVFSPHSGEASQKQDAGNESCFPVTSHGEPASVPPRPKDAGGDDSYHSIGLFCVNISWPPRRVIRFCSQLQLILHGSRGYRASKGKSQDLAPSVSSAVVFLGPAAVLDAGMPQNQPKALLGRRWPTSELRFRRSGPGPENFYSEQVSM